MTLVELLVVLGILAILAAIVFPLVSQAPVRADRTRSLAQMRGVGLGIQKYAAEHGGIAPGPLWPGQVAEFDPNRGGRLVVELAPYLGIEQRTSPYVLNRWITGSQLRAAPGVVPRDLRLYVMNMAVPAETGTINPWGNAAQTNSSPLRLSNLLPGTASSTVMLSEAWQGHPAVANAPWRANTPALPPHGKTALDLYFDGSVR